MRVRSLISAAGLVAGLVVLPQPAHAAVPKVQFTRVWYNSPGVDRRSNASLNGEYVTIANTTRKAINLDGWRIHDKTGYRYQLVDVVLKAGKKLTLRTGRGNDGTSTVFWERRAYVWNNGKDTAYLRDAAGKLIDSCSYNSTRADYTNCS